MEEWFVPPHMIKLAGQEVVNFGYDNTNTITYKFNTHGFRSPEYQNFSNSVIVLGNSVSFGIGLSDTQTFAYQVADQLGYNYINCSLGCYFHENHDHLLNLKILSQRKTNDIFLIQINNLDRHRVDKNTVISTRDTTQCVSKFMDYIAQVELLLTDKKKIYLYWDTVDYHLPSHIVDKFLIYNKFHIDSSLSNNQSAFGQRSNRAISKIILTKLGKFY